ncbi:MAG: TraR/DksA family transcriptional regulator [Acidimicrobiales bacterium]
MPTDASTFEPRKALEHERDSLHAQLGELGYGNRLDYDPNFADSSQVTAERGENDALMGELVELLHEVEHALAKFDTGDYGRCERCSKPIDPARLEARPEARLCIECAASKR